MTDRTYRVLHLFSGIGGGALGFQAARGRWAGLEARFQTVAGIDNDPQACADFEAMTGARAVCADLATMTPAELLDAAGPAAPDVVFASPPCTGFSGLLPKARAEGEHYQLLNRLVLQGLFLVLETWPTQPPKLILIENVPRITTRGAELLAQAESLLRQYGYRWDRSTHDAGALGGLGQHRQRFLLLARHEAQLPTLVYQPPKQRVKSIGEILGALPMPDDPAAGPLHRLPRLQWKTWVRLALIPAGGDWRDLPAGEYVASGDPSLIKGRPGLMGVVPWDAPAGAVTGSASPTGSNGVAAVADPRVDGARWPGTYRVQRWDEPSGTVCGMTDLQTGALSVADPRGKSARTVQPFNNVWAVVRWDEPSGAVTAGGGPSSSGVCVADPRLQHTPRGGSYRVVRWDEQAPTVTGAEGIGRSCAFGVADPRWTAMSPEARKRWEQHGEKTPGGLHLFKGKYTVMPWDKPGRTVIGGPSGGRSPSPPRPRSSRRRGRCRAGRARQGARPPASRSSLPAKQ
jgi:site-specific DNA-cytosine methylase